MLMVRSNLMIKNLIWPTSYKKHDLCALSHMQDHVPGFECQNQLADARIQVLGGVHSA